MRSDVEVASGSEIWVEGQIQVHVHVELQQRRGRKVWLLSKVLCGL